MKIRTMPDAGENQIGEEMVTGEVTATATVGKKAEDRCISCGLWVAMRRDHRNTNNEPVARQNACASCFATVCGSGTCSKHSSAAQSARSYCAPL